MAHHIQQTPIKGLTESIIEGNDFEMKIQTRTILCCCLFFFFFFFFVGAGGDGEVGYVNKQYTVTSSGGSRSLSTIVLMIPLSTTSQVWLF